MPRKAKLVTSIEELSEKERQILGYAKESKLQKEICELANLSPSSVCNILKMLEKSGLFQRIEHRGAKGGELSQQSQRMIDAMLILIEEFYPRTLRAYYYQMVVQNIFPNDQSSYEALQTLMVKTRESGLIPYDAFVDTSRPLHLEYSDEDLYDYVDTFRPYKSDWWRDQEQRVTLWIEKDALMNIVEPIARKYHVDLYCGKGGISLTRVYEASQRINEIGQDTKVLYMGDFDPAGLYLEESLFREMGERHDCYPEHERIAVTYEQAKEFQALGLSNVVKDAKPKNENPSPAQQRGVDNYNKKAAAHREKYGNLSVELDAYTPQQLQDLVSKAIEARCDIDLLLERQEADKVVNARILKALQPLVDECQDYE